MRVLTIASGVLVMLTGAWTYANIGAAFTALAFIVGLVMVIEGCVGCATYLTMKNRPKGMSWFLAEEMLSVELGIVVLSNQLATDLMISMFFGMWVLVSGNIRLVMGIDMKNNENPAWQWTLGLGVVSAAVGIFALVNSVVSLISLGLLVGLLLFIQGINVLEFGVFMPHIKKHHLWQGALEQFRDRGKETK